LLPLLALLSFLGDKVRGVKTEDFSKIMNCTFFACCSGRNQFTPDEDAHVISDCIKHVLRELPSSPVSAPCCTALLEAHRLEGKESRVNAMRTAISNTSPEPNRQLLQRLLRMMRAVSAHAAQNRMTASAVAACMAPLLLRPLLTGECELDDNSDVTADNELLAATAAANNAVAILTMLLEDYDSIFEVSHNMLHSSSFL
jgi:hypothetical protein